MSISLLHIDVSARQNSFSRKLGRVFVDEWQRNSDPDSRYVYRDLAAQPIPFITEAWTEICDYLLEHQITNIADYSKAVRTESQRAAWSIIDPLLEELVHADVVLICTPMYNFSVPASLKAWIDQVAFPKMSLAGRQFVIASARGGSYRAGTPRASVDHQEQYLRDFLKGHFAVDDAEYCAAEMTNARIDPNLAQHLPLHRESAHEAFARARDLGAKFAG
jgi:FMN-dependent NADH-azoreductase